MSGATTVREVLLDSSDQRACRTVWEAVQQDTLDTAASVDLVETLRVCSGDLCLVGHDGLADVYVRHDPNRGFERLTIWPPWNVTDYDGGGSRSEFVSLLDSLTAPELLTVADSPFAHGGVLSSLPGLGWP
ncbi:hypothetical protein [Halomarina oriensis]|uniref:Uncharacterized protein n=1 Tax=Halomarina oriensis TaxID=671145 RepID=A0A6B0GQ59_9EURY|nr:hypothetical protein [Halomarina oriensis]MWG34255.1 hypothetical protein [Halomarina oriensis]